MKSSLPDFPAAHSMDTEWFAVDEDGHVGLFFSGEDGPVPASAERGLELFMFISSFFRPPVSPAARNEVSALLSDPSPDLAGIEEEAGADEGFALEHCLLLMRSKSALKELLQELEDEGEEEVFQLDTPEPILYADRIDYDRLKELLEAGDCLKFRNMGVDGGEPLDPSRLGMFGYESCDGEDLPLPTLNYERTHVPDAPARQEDFPAEVRKLIGQRLIKDATFGTAETINLADQLGERLATSTDSPAYLDEDAGVIRPMPGQEKRYAKEFEKLKAAYGDEYTLTDPDADTSAS